MYSFGCRYWYDIFRGNLLWFRMFGIVYFYYKNLGLVLGKNNMRFKWKKLLG